MSKDKVPDDDESLFEKAMSGVNRSHRNYRQQRIDAEIPRNRPGVKAPVRGLSSTNPSAPVAVDQTEGGDEVLFVRAGLQRKVIRRLKRGEFQYRSVLDLHGMRIHQAESLLQEFLSDALGNGFNCVLIIHGKGHNSENKRGVLKPFTINWLKEPAEVKAFCSAVPKDGGSGAVYVLLKQASATV